MRRFDVATDSDSCPECGARFMVAPCRSCKGKGQTLLFFEVQRLRRGCACLHSRP
jgi:hypothetical protein